MIVKVDKRFAKDTEKIKDAKLRIEIATLIQQIENTETLADIKNIKKLSGYKSYFRIRMGVFRIGIKCISDDEVILIRFLHRKEIYQKWP